MKWVNVGVAHWNTDLIQSFSWSGGRLAVWWLGDDEQPETNRDPDRKMYHALCKALGVRPVEVAENGKS